MDEVITPHDLFFKKFLSDNGMAVDLIKSYIPPEVVKLIDFETLQHVPISFIDNKLRYRQSDVLLQANILDSMVYIYLLFEHLSTPQFIMPLRVATYQIKIMERHLEQYKTKKIPYIFPIVFYNGKVPYPYSTDIREMIEGPNDLVQNFRLGEFHLIDLNDVGDERLRTSSWLNLCCYAMKHAYSSDHAEVLRYIIHEIEELTLSSSDLQTDPMQVSLLYYIINAYRQLDVEKFMDMLQQSKSDQLKKAGLTIAEQLIEKGHQQGLEQGLEQGHQQGLAQGHQQGLAQGQQALVKKMLGGGVSVEYLSQITGIPKDEILRIAALIVG